MGKILHLIPDEKVTDNVIENFEQVFNDNVFFVLGDPNNRKYCKTEGDNIILGSESMFVNENIDADVKGIIIHGLNHIFARLILSVKSDIKISWFAWGFDIYFLPRIGDNLYAQRTLDFIILNDSRFHIVNKIKKNKFLRSIYYKYFKRTDDFYSLYELAHNKIDYFCSYIEEDFNLFSSKYPNKLIFLETGYFSIKQYLAGQESLSVSSNATDILIGNSNSVECNHLDVLEILKFQKNLFKGNVIVPLNYGNDLSYRNKVVEIGKEYFAESFVPLLSFMDRLDYFTLLSNCSTAVFYHYRQQAMGNIIAFLYMGGRVYFSSKNPVYHYLKRIGVIVFDFDFDFATYSNRLLTSKEIFVNRQILDKFFAEEVIFNQSSNLVKKLIDVNR